MTDRSQPLLGRRALITGASRGIGRSIAVLFAQCGADVAIVSRNAETLEGVAAEIRDLGRHCTAISCDVTAADSPQLMVDATQSELGGIDILVNNAGGNSFMAPLETMRLSGWRKAMDLNLDSLVRVTQAALVPLKESGNGAIVNVASVAGVRSSPFMSHYGAAKAAVLSLTASLAGELAEHGVRVNALVPGWVDTDLTDFLRLDESIEAKALADVPMRRWGRPDEIAEGALFLASDASSFMTGQALILDGGLTSRP
jgi:NAD(P)-dependent dehydrogenase (short-subunit alcohol dehydrogenase family)